MSKRYKLFFDRNELTLPKDITTRFPNIVYINGIDTTNKVEMSGVEGAGLDGVTLKNLPRMSMKTGLVSYLKSSGLPKAKRDMARDLVEHAIKELQLD